VYNKHCCSVACAKLDVCDCVNTGSSVGGLPLGVLASSSDTSLQRAVELYAGLLDSRCFYGRGRQRGPALLLVDDCPALRTALCTVFTASSCLLCSCRLLTSFWQELWDRRSTVSIDQRLHCFALFRAAVLADTVDQLDARFVDIVALAQGDYHRMLHFVILRCHCKHKNYIVS